MKKMPVYFLFSLIGFILMGTDSPAGFTIPKDAYRIYELDNALQNAKEDNWALAFLLASEKTTCPLGTKASLNAIRELEEQCIIVYVDAFDNELTKCPGIVLRAFQSQKAGRTLPIVVITDPKCKRIVDIIPYANSEEAYLELLREANNKITESPSLMERIVNMFQ
ncbi:MAG: hypothetical protein MI862_02910 [Desulfobacterales bacterium]|nr:hypothetical protein [Desulfobacterales bacterium]